MIYLNLTGRLGNQLFQYAFARKLQLMRNLSDNLCFSFKEILCRQKEGEGFEDSLRFFNVLPYQTCNKNLVMRFGSLHQILLYILHRLYPKCIDKCKLERNGILFSQNVDVYKFKNVFLYGKYENPKYFEDIIDILKDEFTPKEAPRSCNKELYDAIETSNSICVSIRRGDYLSTNNKNNFYVCNEAYFEKAIAYMKTHVENPVFVFFSDDIEWVKKSIKIEGAKVYYESGDDPVWEKLRLMYSCKNFIISNSTFSWWAQYLSRNSDKIVVSPNRWFVQDNWKSDLIDDSFIKIKV
jgi:hypothetical protein